MTTYRVQVESLDELSAMLGRLADGWQDIAETAMKRALVNTKYLQEAWRRTPKSNRPRYASRYAGVGLKVKQRGDANDPSGWKYGVSSRWRQQAADYSVRQAEAGRKVRAPTARGMDRVDEYGRERLARSILPRVDASALIVRRTQTELRLTLASSLDYAPRVYLAEKPAEGDYWTPGKDSGWSAYGTGNRFLEVPYEQLQDKILQRFAKEIDRQLKEIGLL